MPVRVYGRYKGGGDAKVTRQRRTCTGKPIEQIGRLDVARSRTTPIRRSSGCGRGTASTGCSSEADAGGSRTQRDRRDRAPRRRLFDRDRVHLVHRAGERRGVSALEDRPPQRTRLARDRAAQQAVAQRLEAMRDKAARQLGPITSEQMVDASGRPALGPPPGCVVQPAAAAAFSALQREPAAKQPRLQPAAPGGGGAIDPITAGAAILLAGEAGRRDGRATRDVVSDPARARTSPRAAKRPGGEVEGVLDAPAGSLCCSVTPRLPADCRSSRRSWRCWRSRSSLPRSPRRPCSSTARQWRTVRCGDVTSHLTHWTADHFAWDVLTFASSANSRKRRAGPLRRVSDRFGTRHTAGRLWARPELATYRGLSGVDSALFALVLAELFRRGGAGRVMAAVAGLALASKVGFEAVTGETLFVDSAAGAFTPVPAAHAAGAVVGLVTGATRSSEDSSAGGERFFRLVDFNADGQANVRQQRQLLTEGGRHDSVDTRFLGNERPLSGGVRGRFRMHGKRPVRTGTPTRNVSTYLMSLYEQPAQVAEQPPVAPKPLRLPIRAAVAQVGEVTPTSPPGEAVDLPRRVRPRAGDTECLRRHVRLAAGRSGNRYDTTTPTTPPPAAPCPTPGEPAVRDELQRMRRLAMNMGLDYLVLVGGTIDSKIDSTAASAADLTIVGVFIVPSKAINAEGPHDRGTDRPASEPGRADRLGGEARQQGHSVGGPRRGRNQPAPCQSATMCFPKWRPSWPNCQNQAGVTFGAATG